MCYVTILIFLVSSTLSALMVASPVTVEGVIIYNDFTLNQGRSLPL